MIFIQCHILAGRQWWRQIITGCMARSELNFELQFTLQQFHLLCGQTGVLHSVGSTHKDIIVKRVWMFPIPWSPVQGLDKQMMSDLSIKSFRPQNVPTDFVPWYASWGRAAARRMASLGSKLQLVWHLRSFNCIAGDSAAENKKDNSFLLDYGHQFSITFLLLASVYFLGQKFTRIGINSHSFLPFPKILYYDTVLTILTPGGNSALKIETGFVQVVFTDQI